MGVPGFVVRLKKKYPAKKFIINKDDIHEYQDGKLTRVNNFYLDFNCAMHPKCFEVLAENPDWTNQDRLEEKMLNRIVEYLEELITEVNPQDVVFISVDGVAPVAKIKQQRSRRFKSVADRQVYDNIKKKHGREISKFWNNSAITPGTPFMKKITQKIKQHIESNKDTIYKGLKIIFSSGNTPGEGEHKILQYIRKNDTDDINSVIYGLDTDLIFLALATQQQNVYLFRESKEVDKKYMAETFCYFDIDQLKECILEEIKQLVGNHPDYVVEDDKLSELKERSSEEDKIDISNRTGKLEISDKQIIYDYIFICYLIGNDFLPHIPSVDIYNYQKQYNAVELLLNAYVNCYMLTKDCLMRVSDEGEKKIEFNKKFFQLFLKNLATQETKVLVDGKNVRRFTYPCKSSDEYEIQKHRQDNLLFKIHDPIKLGSDTPDKWKFRYYQNYFHSTIKQNDFIRLICHEYFKGLVWTAHYYFFECPSWSWFYPFDHGPFLSDMSFFLNVFDFDEIKFELGEPLLPYQQLMCVLPPQSSYLVPRACMTLMTSIKSPLIYLYPIGFDQDMLYKKAYWQCIPILPQLDIKAIQVYTQDIKLSREEKDMCKLKKEFIY